MFWTVFLWETLGPGIHVDSISSLNIVADQQFVSASSSIGLNLMISPQDGVRALYYRAVFLIGICPLLPDKYYILYIHITFNKLG